MKKNKKKRQKEKRKRNKKRKQKGYDSKSKYEKCCMRNTYFSRRDGAKFFQRVLNIVGVIDNIVQEIGSRGKETVDKKRG